MHFKLICITDRQVCGGPLVERVAELARHGLRAVQLREKDLADAEYRALLEKIIHACGPAKPDIFINSRVEIAREFAAHLHLPEGANVAAAREALPNKLISAAVHSIEAARAAERTGADLLIAAPIFAPVSKHADETLGLDGLRAVCAAVKIPVFALGGVTPENAGGCLQSGAAGVACVGALMRGNAKRTLKEFQLVLGRL